jgi:hypothetical protein
MIKNFKDIVILLITSGVLILLGIIIIGDYWEMIDKFLYKFFSAIDDMFSWLETYSVKFTSWLWNSRVKLLNKKRKRK